MAGKKIKAQAQHLRDINAIVSTPEGARFIWRLLEKAGIYRTSFSSDVLVMAAQEGQRNIGLWVLSDILQACPEKYINLLKSSKARREKANEEAQHVVEVDPDNPFDSADAGDRYP